MNRFPPSAQLSPLRGSAPGRWLAPALALAVALTCGACVTLRDEPLDGLVVVSIGPVGVTNANGELEPIVGPPGELRGVTASNGRIAVRMEGDRLLASGAPGPGESRTWRQLAPPPSSGRTISGMDLSLDGRTLALVLGDPDTAGLQLVTIEVETGESATRRIDLMSNGPPSWLGPDLLALEVIRADQHSGIATVKSTTGEMTVTDAQGIAPSATRDGGRIAVAESPSGLVITDPGTWLAGGPDNAPGISPPADSTVEDVALDADGTRLAVVYAATSGVSSSVVILRLEGAVWQSLSSIPFPGDAAVSIDWLD